MILHLRRKFTTRMCIVGSGPAGFYTAYKILKSVPEIEIDMFEALPIPFGLVRYGVAPDHPEVKSVQHKFESVAMDKRFNFYGNVRLGTHVSIQDLMQRYSYLCLSYGASTDRKLNIPGEEKIISAREFISFYNGDPSLKNKEYDLSLHEEAIIVGQGNVALDLCRTLLSPIEHLAKTDITNKALEMLEKSRIKRVKVVGRRGPVQVAFSAKEFRELLGFSIKGEAELLEKQLQIFKVERKKRMLDIMLKAFKESSKNAKEIEFLFFKSPKAVVSENDVVTGLECEINDLDQDGNVIPTGNKEFIEGSLIFRSIGYKSVSVPGLPFDEKKGIVPNIQGRVMKDEKVIDGVYVSGWLKTGPMGVIASTMYDAFQTAECVIEDISSGRRRNAMYEDVTKWLSPKTRVITFQDWIEIEKEEKRRGEMVGKPSEKFSELESILKFLDK